jgi:hypothetical protein
MRALFFLCAGAFTLAGTPQALGQAGTPQTISESPGLYYAQEPGNPSARVKLNATRAEMKEVYKIKFNFDITRTGVTVQAVLPGETAKMVIKTRQPVFFFNLSPGTPSSAGLIDSNGKPITSAYSYRLLRFRAKNGNRSVDVGGLSLTGGTASSDKKIEVRFTADTVSPTVFKVHPNAPLAPGQYAFVNVARESDLGDGGVSDTVFDFTIE